MARKDVTDTRLNFHLWQRVFSYTNNHRKSLFALAGVMILFALVDAITPLMSMFAIDEFIVPKETDGLPLFIAVFALIAFLRGFLVWVMIRVGGYTNQNVVYEVRRDSFNHLQKLSFSFFDQRPVGWLMSRLTSDCRNLGNTLSWGVVDIVWGLGIMMMMAIVMLSINFKVALIILSVVPVLLWFSIRYKNRLLSGFRKVREVNSTISGMINEGIMGAQTTKTLVREEENYNEFADITQEMADVSVTAASRAALYLPIVSIIGVFGTAMALYFGGEEVNLWVKNNATGMTIGSLVAFIDYTIRFFQPVQDIARRFTDFQNTQASAERIFSLMETDPEIKDKAGLSDPKGDFDGKVEFKEVNFSYNEKETVLEDFNLTINSGECIALVGETGSGKTTISSLVCRFYEPTSGQILIDGTDYRELPLAWLQSRLGIVLQSPFLFKGTIRDNIAFGMDEVSDDEIINAAKLVNAHDFITSMPDGYDSEIGEGGSGLSVGQKQLLTLARAFLVDPRLFILDEATASIDTHTEKLIQDAIAQIIHGRTSIVIAHRLSTIREADRIIVLEHGKIIEQGSHEELMDLQGHYYNLYMTQLIKEEEREAVNF